MNNEQDSARFHDEISGLWPRKTVTVQEIDIAWRYRFSRFPIGTSISALQQTKADAADKKDPDFSKAYRIACEIGRRRREESNEANLYERGVICQTKAGASIVAEFSEAERNEAWARLRSDQTIGQYYPAVAPTRPDDGWMSTLAIELTGSGFLRERFAELFPGVQYPISAREARGESRSERGPTPQSANLF